MSPWLIKDSSSSVLLVNMQYSCILKAFTSKINHHVLWFWSKDFKPCRVWDISTEDRSCLWFKGDEELVVRYVRLNRINNHYLMRSFNADNSFIASYKGCAIDYHMKPTIRVMAFYKIICNFLFHIIWLIN